MYKEKEDEWRFTGFYGKPDMNIQHESWAKLKRLKNKYSLPRVCVGDFNEIAKAHEKHGGRPRPVRQMEAFREVLSSVGSKTWVLLEVNTLGLEAKVTGT